MNPGHLKGIVEEVGVRGRVKVRIPELDGLVTGWLPVMQPLSFGAKSWSIPRKGSLVVLSPGLSLDDAVVMGCIYAGVDPVPFEAAQILGFEADDGTVFQYDPRSKSLTISKPDSITFETETFRVKGKTELLGDLAVQGDADLAQLLTVAGRDFAAHTHPGVTSGPSMTGPVS